jgi:PhnB protein
MANLSPYLAFNGNCREAMEFYKSALGGELNLMTIGSSAVAAQMPPAAHDNIMHADLVRGDFRLMAADSFGTESLTAGDNVSLMLDCSSAEEIEMLFSNLSQGATITQPLKDEFWGATFGMLTDKYGIHWMFNHQKDQTQG